MELHLHLIAYSCYWSDDHVIASLIYCPFVSIIDLKVLVSSDGTKISRSFHSEHIAFRSVEHQHVAARAVIVTVLAAIIIYFERGHALWDVDSLGLVPIHVDVKSAEV